MIAWDGTVSRERPRLPAVSRLGLAAGYVLAYVAADWVSYLYPVAPLAITVWNPPPGLSLALLLYAGLSQAPSLFVAALIADVVVRGAPGPAWFAFASSFVIAAGYAAVAAVLLRLARVEPALRRVRDVAWLLGAAVAGSGLVAAAFVYLNVLAGLVARPDFALTALRFWTGDAIGVAATTPLLLVLAFPGAHPWASGRPRALEATLQLASLAAALFLVLWWAHPAESTLFYFLFLPVVWIAMRHGLRGTAATLLVVQLVLIGVLWARRNPFETVLEFQLLMLALAATGLLLAAAVDERAQARATLARREEELRTVVETAPDGILAVDAEGRVRSANAAAAAMLGVPADALRGRTLSSFLAEAPDAPGAIPTGERTGMRADGGRFPAEIAVAEAGDSGLRIALLRDVSRRREIEERLRERQEELSRALRLAAAGEMTSALAHELHQPLSAIASYARACQLLSDAGDQARLRETLERMGVEVGRASDVVRRLRDFFRTGAARMERLAVADLVGGALEPSRTRLQRHGIALAVRVPEAPLHVLGDRVQLEVVIHNLVGNSIDALARAGASRREISLRVVQRGAEAELRVEDSGPGVAPELMPRLFTPFVTSKADGMGLGLAISRYIAEAHGGRLWAEPRPSGAAFCLALPLDDGRAAA